MGIGYEDSIVLYNRYEDADTGSEWYYGKRFDNVRIELTQGENVNKSGITTADKVLVKIPNPAAYEYRTPDQWQQSDRENVFTVDPVNHDFFVIAKKRELNVDMSPETGRIDSSEYASGFFQYMKERGLAYAATTFGVYQLIPRYEVGGT